MVDMQKIFQYLTDLENNNNRDWYHSHKKERQEAMKEFEKLIQELINRIALFDDSVLFHNPKDLTFKLVRDTRFSHDKSPYNPTFRAHISSKGKLPIPVGYYIYIKPQNRTFLGGGLFGDMFKEATTMVRDYIVEHGQELETIINDSAFVEHFEIKGTTLKKIPRGYEDTCAMSKYLKHKCWYVEYPMKDMDCLDGEKFVIEAANIFKCMVPFNIYLNTALTNFKMPER